VFFQDVQSLSINYETRPAIINYIHRLHGAHHQQPTSQPPLRTSLLSIRQQIYSKKSKNLFLKMTHKDSEWNRLIQLRVLLVVPQQSRPKSRSDSRPLKEKVSDNLFHLTQVSGQIRRPERSGRSLERKNSRLFFWKLPDLLAGPAMPHGST